MNVNQPTKSQVGLGLKRVQEKRGGLGRGNCGLRNLSCCLSPRYWRSPERKGQPLGEWRNLNSKPRLQKTFLSNFSCDKLKFEAKASDSQIHALGECIKLKIRQIPLPDFYHSILYSFSPLAISSSSNSSSQPFFLSP